MLLDNSNGICCERRPFLANEYLPMEQVSQMLDETYELDNPTIYKKAPDKEKILELCKTALQSVMIDEEKADYHKGLALFYQHRGKYSKALCEWKILSKLQSGWKAYNRMGILYSSKCRGVEGNLEAALRSFQKGADKKDISATFNLALTYDKLRFKAKTNEAREKCRNQARKNYRKVIALLPLNDFTSITAKFNSIYLSHLDNAGAFAPKELTQAKKAYGNLKNPNDSRIPLMRASVEFLINRQCNISSYHNVYKWLEESAKSENRVAQEILSHRDTTDFEKEFEAKLKAPQSGYKHFSLYGSNRL